MTINGITQKILDTECKYAKMCNMNYLRIDGPLIGCHHDTAGNENKWFGIKLCIASDIAGPQFEYGNLEAKNDLDTMNSCKYKNPLIIDEIRLQKRLAEKDAIYNLADMTKKRINDDGINDVLFKTRNDLEGAISFVMLNYLNSNNYESKDFDTRMSMRKDAASIIRNISQKIRDTIEVIL
ncbi:MAG: hypothetical protein ACP5N1_02525 [Candidatus Woesearchaeota archaeon]